MSPPSPDRTLRRMAADLAALHEDDIAAILDELGGEERRIVRNLLQEYAGSASGDLPASAPLRECDSSQLSPWLAECVRSARDRAMTAQAHKALRDCAIQFYPAPTDPPSAAPRRMRGLLGRALTRQALP